MMDSNNNAEKKYSLYEIQKGDTLESIAKKLQVEFDDLRQFHNKWSSVEDCLTGELLSHLKFLKIRNKQDNEEEIAVERKPQPVSFVSQEVVVPFRPFELNHQYWVKYTIQKEGVTQTIEQNYRVRRLKPDTNQTDFHFIQIDKISELQIDGKPVSTKVYKMAEKTADLLYPLRIVVNKYGKWQDLNSYNKLKERWEKQRKEIKDSFDGKSFEILTRNIEKIIEDDKLLLRFMAGNWFLRAFFNGIHTSYTRKFEIEKKLYFPAIAGTEDIAFLITQKVNPYLNKSDLIEVTQIGKPEDEYLDGSYSATYLLNPNNYIIEQLVLECDFRDRNHNIKVEVKNLDNSKVILDSGISVLINK